MEPLVVVGAGIVVYFSYRALLDEMRDLRRYRFARLLRWSRAARVARCLGEERQTPALEKLQGILRLRQAGATWSRRKERLWRGPFPPETPAGTGATDGKEAVPHGWAPVSLRGGARP